MADTDNLQAAIAALQHALGRVRVLVADHPGNQLFYDTENSLATTILNLVTRQAQSQTPPMDGATAAFYGNSQGW
jgi:hypothetical protein